MGGSPGGWAVRTYDPTDFSKTIEIVSNFKGFHERTLDDIMVFNGLYGIDSYMLWYVHKDLHGYDFNNSHLNLRIFSDMNKTKPFWENNYRVTEVKFDPKVGKYVVFALSEDSIILNTKLVTWEITGVSFDEDRDSKGFLTEILEDNDILAVQFFEHPNEELINFEYKQVTFDPDWTVRDFINYVCDDNKYEWCVYNRVLYVGKELKARISMNITSKYSEERDQIAEGVIFKKISGDLRPADVLGHISKKWKCVWAKHLVGASGGVTKACFTSIGSGKIDKKLYLHSLEGPREIANATYIFAHNQFNSYSIGIGNILKDDGNVSWIDEVSVQKDADTLKVRSPNEMVFDRGNEDDISQVVMLKEKIPRSTPYLDHEAGLLFPSPKLEDKKPPPNSIIFNVKDREESSVIGPYVMGNGKNLVIPYKEKGDLRLQLPNGWCLYIKEDGTTYLRVANVDSQAKSSSLVDGTEQDKDVWIKLGTGIADKSIKMNSPEIIKLQAVNDVELYSKFTITIDGQTYIYVGPNANGVLIAGGGHKLSHVEHTHPLSGGTDGLFKMPLIGNSIPHPEVDGTIRTEAD